MDHTPKINQYKNCCLAFKCIIASLFFTGLTAFHECFAQNEVIVSVFVAPPYSTKIDYYRTNPQQVTITLASQSRNTVSLQLRGSIIGENGIKIFTPPQYRSPQPITLMPGETKVLNALAIKELFDIDRLVIRGASIDDLRAGNGLPEGTYRICARAYDYAQPEIAYSVDEPLGCSNPFRITNLEPPMIIKPFYDETLAANKPQNVLFTWSFPAGAPPSTLFKLKIVEIFNEERNINDAMFSSTTPAFFEQSVTGNAFLFGPAQPSLIPGRKYAFMVTAVDPFNRTVFRNGGRSEVSTFRYGAAPAPTGFPNINAFTVKNAVAPLTCSCLEALPDGAVDNSKATVGSKVKIGKFEMTVLEATEAAGVLKGSGKINFPMINSKLIPILVEFADLQVNASNQALSGTVKAKVKSDVDFMPTAPAPNLQSLPFSSTDVQKLDQYFKANVQQLVSNINSSIDNAGFEMPLGLDKSVGGVGTVIAITGATFTPTQATFEAATVINIPDGATKIALGARSVCMDNAGLCGQGTLFLAEDFNIVPLNMRLKGATANLFNPLDSGTYVTFDKDGFKKLRIQAEYAFPTSMLVKKVDKVSQVKATLTASALTWSDWMAKVDIDPFYLAGETDFGFSLAGNGTYDHSSTSNPTGMPSIEAKSNISTPDWNGFYLPQLTVELPAIVKKAGGGPPLTAAAKDLIIDSQGLSGSLNAINVLAIGDGDLGGWYYSVDNIGVTFLNNSFVSGGMSGKVILPISGSNPTDPKGQLDYTSTLSKPAGALEFQFVIKSKNDLDVPMWYSKFTLANTSNIVVKAGAGDFYAAATLSGSMDIVADLSPLSKINFRAMEFQELKVQTVAPYIGVKTFSAGLASPSKSLAGFDVGLEEIKPVVTGNKAGIGFTMKVSLCDIETVPEATFGFKVLGNIGFNGKRPDWKYDGITMDAFSISGPIGPLKVHGEIAFFDNDPEFGNGVRGKLKATMISVFETEAQVLFGKKDFHYWYVDARVKFPPPGITFSPPLPLGVFGFGGGAYYHLAQKPLLNPKDLYGSTPPLTNLYTPNANTAGFKATIILGISDGSSFQMAGTFEATLNAKTMAPVAMKIEVDAAMLAPLMQTENAFVRGKGVISYDFANDIFDAAVGVNVNLVNIINGHGFVHFNINGSKDEWFFKVGEPSDRITLSVLDFVNFDSYLMMGNSGIPGIPDPPAHVTNQLKGYSPMRLGSMGTGEGFAFGASMNFGPADLEFLIFYLRLGAGIGFDIGLQKFKEGCNGNSNLPGIDGWYANGQMWMWAEFAFGLYVDVWFFEGRVAAAEAKMAALLRAGIPNPTWFEGWLHGEFNVLGGLISGKMNFHVEVGDKCVPAADPFGGIPLISDLSPSGDKISIMADPQAAFNFPVQNEFTLRTLNGNGDEENRTFLIEITQFDVVMEKNGEVVAELSTSKEFKISNGSKLATLYTRKAFEPHEKMKVRVMVKAFEIVGNAKIPCTHKGNPVEEYKEISFTTGECKMESKYILGSYPIANQRYFLQRESSTGFFQLPKEIDCIRNNTAYDFLVVFTSFSPEGGTKTTETSVTFSGDVLRFNIPTLANDQIIEARLISRRRISMDLAASQNLVSVGGGSMVANASNFAQQSVNRYVDKYNLVNVAVNRLTGVAQSLKRIPDQVIASYHFKTSKFNTLAEKLAHSQASADATKSTLGILEFYNVEYGVEEGFDVFDVHGYAFQAQDSPYKIGPLLTIYESSPRNRWGESYVRNYFYLNWMKSYFGGYTEEFSPAWIRHFATPVDEAIAFAPASRPIDMYFSSIDPPLSRSEINSATAIHNLFSVTNASASNVMKFIVEK